MMKGMPTGFKDMHGNDICIGDQTRLVVDEEERIFDVCFKSVEREVVTYKDFEPNSVKVMVRGIVFSWKGYDLLPCIDEFGNMDTSKMEIIAHVNQSTIKMVKTDENHYVPEEWCSFTNPATSGGISQIDDIDMPCFGDCNGECEYCDLQQILDQYAEWTCQTK